jgi:signal transduction histidine kinase
MSLKEPVAEAVGRVAARAHAKHVVIFNDVKGTEGQVLIDGGRIAQALQNLLENAIHHTPSGSSVTVAGWSFESGGRRWLCLTVDDSGPGFTAESLSSVFEPFYTTRPGGTGLGLSIVQRIVSIHGGRVFASNREEGGARMTIWLPLREDT